MKTKHQKEIEAKDEIIEKLSNQLAKSTAVMNKMAITFRELIEDIKETIK